MWLLTDEVLIVEVYVHDIASVCAAYVVDDGWDGLKEQSSVEAGSVEEGLEIGV